MSWDSYLDNLAGHCVQSLDFGAIIGLDGSKWTTDFHALSLKITPAEVATIVAAFKAQDYTTFQASGIHIAGMKYQFLRGDSEPALVLGKKKDEGAITLQASKSAIVIGHCIEGKSQGNVNKGVGVIAEYLESLGM